MAKVYGHCCICGRHDELSFEHVPPRAAFNDQRIFVKRGRALFERGLIGRHDADKGEPQQRGAGEYTLCNPCNSATGRYGRAYAEWALEAARLLMAAPGKLQLAYPYHLFPLRVMKQVVCMFMSASGPELRSRIPYLEKFVMDKRQVGLPPDVRIHAGLTHGNFSRTAGVSGLLAHGTPHVFAEIAFRPFVFIMTLASRCPEPRMVDVSVFAQYHIDQPGVLYLPLPVLDVRSQYPSDYRSEQEIVRAAEAEHEMPRQV
jgi:hypothetical protein